ncbi:2-isopropylmalate synthase [Spirochaeta cellobiosiphila]|uniref:2-isopropylmalate synthase n=1 Tax=Spirochaeta cellobiosiphila TaxID=504483 RepID=UPI000422DA79|nr:2-isopropylmalate synthase [Spirochaeta cellobiosiphila]
MSKYQAYPQVKLDSRDWPDKVIEKAPIWCSVDLRDGNQALAVPMNVDQKLKMFDLLVELGFKEIEVGFPSASQIEFDFIRRLVDENRIPDGVTLQVLTQAREHLIRRTFESLKGVKKAILHLYNSTSTLQRKVTFNKSKEEIKTIAIEGTKLVADLLGEVEGTDIRLEYSPESFTGTELDYALDVCESVIDVWNPDKRGPVIINLPATVEMSTPNIYADQIEWFHKSLKRRDQVILSLHTHNDRGTGVAATELALMAGADRVEGTLFGNGERTGNLDIVTVALNMFSQGIDPELDFHELSKVEAIYEECTNMTIHPRHPYAGELVFTAFSGSHQDAIKKGMDRMEQDSMIHWEVPYLPIDPRDIGKSYEAIIRINSQSGKGGVSYILDREFALKLPKAMHPSVGKVVNAVSDSLVKELKPQEIYEIFSKEFVNKQEPFRILSYDITSSVGDKVACKAKTEFKGEIFEIQGEGNGPLSAFIQAMHVHHWNGFQIENFSEQSIGGGTETEAAAYIQIKDNMGRTFWGAGRNTDSTAASLLALVSAFNRSQG